MQNEAELLEVLEAELATADLDRLVVMGGHFMLFEDAEAGKLVPGIIDEQSSAAMRRRIAGRVGIFPQYTWDLSVSLLGRYADRCTDPRLLLLVNDWQYVPTGGRPASELRAEFFEAFDALPAGYRRALVDAGFSTGNVLPSRKHPVAFPETWLKYRFQKAADRFVKQGRLEKRFVHGSATDTEVAFLDEEGNDRTLISCGVTGCAGEITEMVSEVHKLGYRTLVIFAPGECLGPVRTGVEIALNLYELPDMLVIVADPGGSGEMSVDEIFANLVHVSTFRS